ncbi:MAG: glycogen debranching enzyme N-terminal domain-containing protein, partial [Desulfosalsimonas sp.]
MTVSEKVIQIPAPGTRHLVYRGDVFIFRLEVSANEKGTAWLRTNIGNSDTARQEISRHVEHNEALLYHDWTDIPMQKAAGPGFELRVPLCEIGHFEAKAYFLPDSSLQPVWPEGQNSEINVEPAETVCGNIIYNAFVRQFGPNKEKRRLPTESSDFCSLDQQGFTVIPPSGKFRDLIKQLDFIVHDLGCRFIQLLPVHPAPTTYGRMGRFGSPYAAQSFTAVDPAMAEFDPRATPLEQFTELVDEVHRRGARIILDIAINHTGWGAAIHETHPHWLRREHDGRIQMPGAWGVTWEDLTHLDYSYTDLWVYMAEVFLVWCRRGVDGFRCDAGYMIPVETWTYIVAKVRRQFPDTVFFLEGLGGKISVTRALLDTAGFNWAYSEMFQNYNRDEICGHLPMNDEISAADGIMVHFAETHDNNRLASVSKKYAKMRTALCALLSRAGGFGFANGVEWFAEEKIDVHDANPLNWGAGENQAGHIKRLSTLLKNHPVFLRSGSEQRFVMEGHGNFIAVLRREPKLEKALLVIVNMEYEQETTARWSPGLNPGPEGCFYDLITGEKIAARFLTEGVYELLLEPGRVLCLSSDPSDLEILEKPGEKLHADSGAGMEQRLKAAALDVFVHFHGISDAGRFSPERASKELSKDPEAFCRRMNPQKSGEPRVVSWQWPGDSRREVMVPPGHFVLVRSPFYFRARLVEDECTVYTGYAMTLAGGGYFLLIPARNAPAGHKQVVLKIAAYEENDVVRESAPLLYLAPHEAACARRAINRQELISENFMFLATNGRGAMMRAATRPRKIHSRYDAILAANPHDSMPVDRWIMLSRCRAWVVYQDYSQAVRTDCLQKFFFDYDNRGQWLYMVPTGLGRHIMLTVQMQMISGENRVLVRFTRHPADSSEQLEDGLAVDLIVRPDIENRSFHETTKAFAGPEYQWPASVFPRENGFSFRPDAHHCLEVELAGAEFVYEPEWKYMVNRSLEAERGLDPDSDLFSPGYFRAGLKGGKGLVLEASMGKAGDGTGTEQIPPAGSGEAEPAPYP